MEITLNDRRTIHEIQDEFNAVFPYLKLDFAYKSHLSEEALCKRYTNNMKTLGECRTIHKNEYFSITPDMTVSDLEHFFYNIYGLAVQVLRKSGKVWLGTTVTDGWTLEKQNEQGEALSNNSS